MSFNGVLDESAPAIPILDMGHDCVSGFYFKLQFKYPKDCLEDE